MNRDEAAYAEMLRDDPEVAEHWYEGITLKLGPDCRYTPDFLVWRVDGELQLHEVKGRRREDAMVKLRVCLERFPFRIYLIEKGNAKEFIG